VTVDSLGKLTFRSTFGGSLLNIQCTVQLRGSVNRVIAKTHGSSFGTLTTGFASPCDNALGQTVTATVQGFSWPLTYLTFTGTLPSPTLVVFLVNNANFTISIGGGITPAGGCNFRGTVPASILLTGGSPNTTAGLIHVLRNRSPGTTVDPLCPREGELVGLFSLVQRQTLILVN
jgi:hypothetical protein